MNNYDVIVIGAGNGGLSCALSLSKETKNVLLIEKNDYPGGVASSFVRGRFEFETALCGLRDFGTPSEPGKIRKLFQNYGLGLSWLSTKDCFRLIAPLKDGTMLDVRMPTGRENFIFAMEKAVPHSEKGMRKFFFLADESNKAIDYLEKANGRPNLKYLREKYPNFLKIASYSTEAVLKALRLPPRAAAILEAYWHYLGMDATRLNFLHYLTVANDLIEHGVFIPKGTSNAITTAMLKRFLQEGGQVLFNTLALRFLFDEKKHVSGITTSQGEFFSRHIVFDGSPHAVYEGMVPLEMVPEEALQRAKARSFSGRPFCLYLGLNQSAETLGITDYLLFLPTTLDTKRAYELASSFETLDSCIALCYNLVDPAFSPKGTCVMSFLRMSTKDIWGKVAVKDYFNKKDEVASKILSLYQARTGLNLKPYIEEMEIATPWTFARYNGAPEGAVYGYENKNWDSLPNRIRAAKKEKEIAGLFFVGAFSYRGNGYSSAYISGAEIAKRIIGELRKEN